MKKRFAAVAFQRKAREELSKEYNANPKAFMKRLELKYGKPLQFHPKRRTA